MSSVATSTQSGNYYITCVFCGEVLLEDGWEERVRHVGRHMEEIAFTVVTKSYEDWEFYSDASSSKLHCTDTTC